MENEHQPEVALWNPNAARYWSILLTPIFGAWIHAKNWKALGQETKAKRSMYWVYGTFLIAIACIPDYVTDREARFIGFIYLLMWIAVAKDQVTYIQKKFGKNYKKKSWRKPLTIGLGIYFVYVALIVAIFMLGGGAALYQK